jgi:4-hydroxy-tetrahydrodipicolinate synthase
VIYQTLMGVGTWPSSLKAALALIGLPAGVPRDPVLPLTDADLDALRRTLEELGLLTGGEPGRN